MNSDNTFEVLIDQEMVNSGSLLEDVRYVSVSNERLVDKLFVVVNGLATSMTRIMITVLTYLLK